MKREYKSSDYNWVFDTDTGLFARWGEDFPSNPTYSRIGPEILDIEVSTICNNGCPFCYKSNTSKGKYMTFDTFKNIVDKMDRNLTQIALGIGDVDYDISTLKNILEYSRSKNIIPNITINGNSLTPEIISILTSLCGAISVSNYDVNTTIEVVNKLSVDYKHPQINIHQLVAYETFFQTVEIMAMIKEGKMPNLNALIFLSLKPKGDRNSFKSYKDMKQYELLLIFIDELLKEKPKTKIGFDSCFAPILLSLTGDRFKESIEPCESALFSSYVNVEGDFYPCSFTENTKGWEKGLSVLDCKDFLEEIWFDTKVEAWREHLITTSKIRCTSCSSKELCRLCLAFPIINLCREIL